MEMGNGETRYFQRVRLVNDRWRKKVKFSTPQAEKAIMGTLDSMRNLMDRPMTLNGEILKDDAGKPIPRRKFWQLAPAEEVEELMAPENLNAIDSLEQLADIIFLAKFEPPLLNKIYANKDFLVKVATLRDENENNLLHWIAAADLPRKILYGIFGGLRKMYESEDTDPQYRQAMLEAMRSENKRGVKLHEIAFALKDENLATELMRSKISVREQNRIGLNFVDEALRSEGGEEYLRKLGDIAEKEQLEPEVVEELRVTETDREVARVLSEADDVLENFLHGDRVHFQTRLRQALQREPAALQLFFERNAEAAAQNRGIFHFGRLDREGRDWLYYVLDQGDLDTLGSCMTLVERFARQVAENFAKARPNLQVDDVVRQLLRVYLKTECAKGLNPLHHAIATKKATFLQRLLDSALFHHQEISNEKDATRKRDMLSKNMSLLVGKRINDNLFLQVALREPPGPGVDEDDATTIAMKFLEVLFEPLQQEQGYALFRMTYRIGQPPDTKEVNFLNFIQRHRGILKRVKEAFELYSTMYMTPDE